MIRKRSIIISTVMLVAILGITLGIIIHVYSNEKIEKATIQQIKEINRINENQIVVETASNEEKTTPNTTVVFETYYAQCGHSKTEKKTIDGYEVNKTKEEIEKIYPKWRIKKFSSKEVLLYREENELCENHYLIKEKDGHINVYSINKDGNEELKRETEIVTQYLPEKDIYLLQNGIKVNSESELEEVLSDYD